MKSCVSIKSGLRAVPRRNVISGRYRFGFESECLGANYPLQRLTRPGVMNRLACAVELLGIELFAAYRQEIVDPLHVEKKAVALAFHLPALKVLDQIALPVVMAPAKPGFLKALKSMS